MSILEPEVKAEPLDQALPNSSMKPDMPVVTASLDSEQTGGSTEKSSDLYDVIVNGELVQVSLQEALDGYSRGEDMRAKESNLQAERAKFDQARQNLIDNQLEQAESACAVLARQVAAENARDWTRLSIEQPKLYEAGLVALQQKTALLASMQKEMDGLRRHLHGLRATGRREALTARYPELVKDEHWQSFEQEAEDFLRKRGYSTAEIYSKFLPRDLAVVYDALQYRKLADSRANIRERRSQRAAITPMRPAAPASSSAPETERHLLKAHAISGGLKEQAAFFEAALAAFRTK